MHLGNRLWWNEVVARWPTHFRGAGVLEVGSYNVNGSIRDHVIEHGSYHGIDWRAGPAVDEVCLAHEFVPAPRDRRFDTLVSASMLEHDPHWARSVANTMQFLRPGGRAFWSWCTHESAPHCQHSAPDGGYHALKQEAVLHLLEGLGYGIEWVIREGPEFQIPENHCCDLVAVRSTGLAPWDRTTIPPSDRLTPDERCEIESFIGAWRPWA